jgi:magnesium-dependent phosphatase 1
MTSARDYSGVEGLKLVAFDLDGTIWNPEMYQLWGGGPPFNVVPNTNDLVDRNGTKVKLLGISAEVLHDLRHEPLLGCPKIAWVSCCDEPAWAEECLTKFVTEPSRLPLCHIAHASEIYDANKQAHFKSLRELYPDIEFSEMLFYDNQMNNIHSVSKLGVKCVFCPMGVTEEAWEEGLRLFRP